MNSNDIQWATTRYAYGEIHLCRLPTRDYLRVKSFEGMYEVKFRPMPYDPDVVGIRYTNLTEERAVELLAIYGVGRWN